MTVTLNPVTEADRPVLSRLMNDYQRELAPYAGLSPDEVGEYRYLADYFTDPTRVALFISVDDQIGGFVFINTHTIVAARAHSIAEFYVAPEYRKRGVGEQAATLAFAKFTGEWEVAQMATNVGAVAFWRKVVKSVTNDRYKETILDSDAWHGPVQTFEILQ